MRQTDTRPGYWADMLPDGSDALAGVFAARDYYWGQADPLYALASSGYLGADPDALDKLADLLTTAARSPKYPTDGDNPRADTDAEWLAALAAWCRTRAAADRGQG